MLLALLNITSLLYDILCRFVHPGVTDKGNYTMFEMVRPLVPVNGPPPMYGPPMDPFRPPPMMERPMVEYYSLEVLNLIIQ